MDDVSPVDGVANPALAAGAAMTFRIDFDPSDTADARLQSGESGLGDPDPLAAEEASAMLDGALSAPEDEVAGEIDPAAAFASRAAMEMDAGAEAIAVDSSPEPPAETEALPPVEFRPSVAPRPEKRRKTGAPSPAAPPRRRAMPQILGSLLLGLVGSAAGYYGLLYHWVEPVEIHPLVEPLDPVLLGGLLGLLIGWVAVRWTAKRH